MSFALEKEANEYQCTEADMMRELTVSFNVRNIKKFYLINSAESKLKEETIFLCKAIKTKPRVSPREGKGLLADKARHGNHLAVNMFHLENSGGNNYQEAGLSPNKGKKNP